MPLESIANGRYTYRIDLSGMPQKAFETLAEVIDNTVISCKYVPGTQVLQVYWNSDVPLEQYFNLPPGSVSLWGQGK